MTASSRYITAEDLLPLIRRSMARRRGVLVHALAEQLSQLLELSGPGAEEWLEIESLSQLRATVGGRFTKIKERWLNAGFPLREHKGERRGKARLNERGWHELAAWVDGQGFDVRLVSGEEPVLFCVRRRER